MTPAALHRLREIHAERRRLDDEEARILDALDAAPAPAPATTWISTGRAQQIIRANSPNSIYRLIDKHPDVARLGPNKRWQIDERKLRGLFDRDRGESGEARGESGE